MWFYGCPLIKGNHNTKTAPNFLDSPQNEGTLWSEASTDTQSAAHTLTSQAHTYAP